MKNILITGGAGYIGSHSILPLKEEGYNPIVVDNLSTGHKEAVKSAELIVADLNDTEKLDAVFKEHKIDSVMHFAGSCYVEESVTNPQKYFLNNVSSTLNLLDVMLANEVDNIVFSSSCTVYGEPICLPIKEDHPKSPKNPYGLAKLFIEQILEQYSKAYEFYYASLRYFNAAGASTKEQIGEDHLPETHLIPLALGAVMGKSDEFKIFGDDYSTHDGTCIRDYIHIDDIISAHILSLNAINENCACYTFNVGTGTGYTTKEVVSVVEEVAGKTIEYEMAGKRAGDVEKLVASPEKINTELGWEPKYRKLTDIISTAWEWHKNNPDGYGDK